MELERRGEITIHEIKNRFRDGATASGYMDMNLRIKFRGFLCEIQLLIQSLFDLNLIDRLVGTLGLSRVPAGFARMRKNAAFMPMVCTRTDASRACAVDTCRTI